jgi:hypothetical protein
MANFFVQLVCGVEGISVPTGKETPITPARPTQSPVVPRVTRAPAPVHEYTQDNPEPPPLDPSWIPQTYKYINALRPEAIVYVSTLIRQKKYWTHVPQVKNNIK